MFDSNAQKIIVFIICCSLFVLILIGFIILLVYRYQQRQVVFFQKIKDLEIVYENQILQSQIEIQEQTFQNVSREIHDNIGQKLSLAKLHLNTFYSIQGTTNDYQVADSIKILTHAISDLSDISRSMSSEQILNNGLIPALEYEIMQYRKAGMLTIEFTTNGIATYFDKQKELVVFRIVQEAFNNIIKHASASVIDVKLLYRTDHALLTITDNGLGFSKDIGKQPGIGILNMKKRAIIIGGEILFSSNKEEGTTLTIKIPLK